MELKIDKKISRGVMISLLVFVVAYLLLRETERVKVIWNFLTGIFSPFVIGALLAFIMNVPTRFFEGRLTRIKNEKARRIIAICCMLLSVLAVLIGVLLLLVPQIEDTIRTLVGQLPGFLMGVGDMVNEFLTNHPQIQEILGLEGQSVSIQWGALVETIMLALESSVSTIVGSAVSLVSTLASGTVNAVFSIIFAFYCLARKETLARQGRKMLYSFLKPHKADEVVRVMRMTNSTFSNFITGQCIEAVILGLLFVPAMAAFRMPYIPLICVVITITALVPLVGAFAGCILGAFFILVNDPMQAVIFVLMFLLIQQFEGNVIYPKVVGESIGLPDMWVLLAVAVGGGLMGVMGMFLMVPLASVLYTLLREFTSKRVEERNIPQEKLECQPPDLQPHFMFTIRKRRQAKKAAKSKKTAKSESE